MPKYLFQGSYTSEGVKGVLQRGGVARRAATEQLVESLGGRLECFYFAFGSDDFAIVADLPDQQTAVAASLAVAADGHIRTRTVVLVSPEEIDEAAKMTVPFHPPGT